MLTQPDFSQYSNATLIRTNYYILSNHLKAAFQALGLRLENASPPPRILSLGCGIAHEVVALSELFNIPMEFVLVDKADDQIASLRKLYGHCPNVRIIQADVNDVDGLLSQHGLERNSFNLVVARNLQYIVQSRFTVSALTKAIPELVRDGGILYLSSDDEKELRAMKKYYACPSDIFSNLPASQQWKMGIKIEITDGPGIRFLGQNQLVYPDHAVMLVKFSKAEFEKMRPHAAMLTSTLLLQLAEMIGPQVTNPNCQSEINARRREHFASLISLLGNNAIVLGYNFMRVVTSFYAKVMDETKPEIKRFLESYTATVLGSETSTPTEAEKLKFYQIMLMDSFIDNHPILPNEVEQLAYRILIQKLLRECTPSSTAGMFNSLDELNQNAKELRVAVATGDLQSALDKITLLNPAQINQAGAASLQTALHRACQFGKTLKANTSKESQNYYTIIRALLEAGANPLFLDSAKKSPLNYFLSHADTSTEALQQEFREVKQLLIDACKREVFKCDPNNLHRNLWDFKVDEATGNICLNTISNAASRSTLRREI